MRRGGFTLVEVLTATMLSLVLMAAVTQMFAQMGRASPTTRSILETAERLRTAAARLQADLDGYTARFFPPAAWRMPQIFGDQGRRLRQPTAIDSATGNADSTVGETNDWLMFTTRNAAKPSPAFISQAAEPNR